MICFYFVIKKIFKTYQLFSVRVGGRTCPELDRFLNGLEHADLFQACLEREGWDTWAGRRGRYPTLTCRNGARNKARGHQQADHSMFE